MTRILVFTPTYGGLLRDETVKSIQALAFEGAVEWVVREDNQYPGRDVRNCLGQFAQGREMALAGDYDGLLLVEHDMIVPVDGLQRLWDSPADVVYGCYVFRHGMRVINLLQHTGTANIGQSLSLYPKELAAAAKRGWVEVSGAGFGCLLIRRAVLERVAFRSVDGAAPDLPFAADCVGLGIRQIGRTDVRCGHVDSESGQTLWPFEGSDGMSVQVIALQTVNISDDGQAVRLVQGQGYSLGGQVASELARAGYVVIEVADGYETATVPQAETAAVKPVKRTRKKAGA